MLVYFPNINSPHSTWNQSLHKVTQSNTRYPCSHYCGFMYYVCIYPWKKEQNLINGETFVFFLFLNITFTLLKTSIEFLWPQFSPPCRGSAVSSSNETIVDLSSSQGSWDGERSGWRKSQTTRRSYWNSTLAGKCKGCWTKIIKTCSPHLWKRQSITTIHFFIHICCLNYI